MTTRVFRIFVSSTFSDLKAERNALQRHVFPRLAELCARHGCRFQAIDLRWGVREEAALDQRTMSICLEEIARCRRLTPKPNFIVLLGDRYGWQPLPFAIPAAELEDIARRVSTDERRLLEDWYRRDDNAVPPVYELRPRERELRDAARWLAVERRLRAILRAATVGFPRDRARRYTASATEQEIEAGALHENEEPGEHAFCFFRSIRDVPHDRGIHEFLDFDDHGRVDLNAGHRLRELKERLRSHLAGRIHDYDAEWRNGAPSNDHVGSLPFDTDECLALNERTDLPPTLCVDVWRRLSTAVLAQIAHLERASPLHREIAYHRQWGSERAKRFIGRAAALDAIDAYVGGDDPRPLVIFGAPGSGKTALLGQVMTRCATSRGVDPLVRFIGATPPSSDGRTLLESLCTEIAQAYGAAQTDVPGDYRDLVKRFSELLALATGAKPLVIVLDGLDQLAETNHARDLMWIPTQLPKHVRMVLSATPGDCLSALERRVPPAIRLELQPMPEEEAADLLDAWLADAMRVIQPGQREEVLRKFVAVGLPLYLKLAFEEARRWTSYASPDRTVLGADVPRLIHDLFERLCDDANHGRVLVSRALGYLCAARRGLSEAELIDALSADPDVLADFKRRARHDPPEPRLPFVIWSRLYSDLEPYLSEYAARETTLLGFYHRQLGVAATAAFLSGPERQRAHRHLAEYFQAQDYFLDAVETQREQARINPMTPRAVNVRKVDELPWHRIELARLGSDRDSVEQLLTSPPFLEAKCEGGMVFDLARDFASAIAVLTGAVAPSRRIIRRAAEWLGLGARRSDTARASQRILRLLEEALLRDAAFINKHPCTLFQCLWNSCWWYDSPEAARHYVPPAEGWSRKGPPWERSENGLHRLLDGWGQSTVRSEIWLRALRPPFQPLGTLQATVLQGHPEAVESISFDPGGRRLAAAAGYRVRLWDWRTGEDLGSLKGHKDAIREIAFAPNSRLLISASDDGTIRLWDPVACRLTHVLHREDALIESVAFSPDGRIIAAPSPENARVLLWDAHTLKPLTSLAGRDVGAVAFSPVDPILATSGRRVLRLWSLASKTEVAVRGDAEIDGFCRPRFSPDGRIIAGHEGKVTTLWSATTLKTIASLGGHSAAVTAVAFSPDGSLLATTSQDKTARLWNVRTRREIAVLHGHDGCVTSVTFSPDGSHVATGSDDESVRVWRAAPTESAPVLPDHEGPIRAISISPDQRRAASAGTEAVRLWDLSTGVQVGVIIHDCPARTLGFSPNGRLLATASGDHTVRIWHTDTLREEAILPHSDDVEHLAFSPDGTRLATATGRTAHVWDLTARRTLCSMDNRGKIDQLAFGDSGARLVCDITEPGVRTRSKTVVWNAETGALIQSLEDDAHRAYRDAAQRASSVGMRFVRKDTMLEQLEALEETSDDYDDDGDEIDAESLAFEDELSVAPETLIADAHSGAVAAVCPAFLRTANREGTIWAGGQRHVLMYAVQNGPYSPTRVGPVSDPQHPLTVTAARMHPAQGQRVPAPASPPPVQRRGSYETILNSSTSLLVRLLAWCAARIDLLSSRRWKKLIHRGRLRGQGRTPRPMTRLGRLGRLEAQLRVKRKHGLV